MRGTLSVSLNVELEEYRKELRRVRRSVAFLWTFVAIVSAGWLVGKLGEIIALTAHPIVSRTGDTFRIFTHDNRDPSIIPAFLVVQDGSSLRSAKLPPLPLMVESGSWEVDAAKLKWLNQDGGQAEAPQSGEDVRLVYLQGAWGKKG